ncbi:MAG: hypothetical protein NC226_09570 [Bacteroides cellulosilyticus]|nr:hypothetical protein [Bacteroides cellulosilyticus]
MNKKMKIGLLKKLRAYARKSIYIERCFAGVRQPPRYIVRDIEHGQNIGEHEFITYDKAVEILYCLRRKLIEHKSYKIRMERQRAIDNKILDL